MNYAKKYLNFINGRYASEGIRITCGVVVPSLVMNFFWELPVGLTMSFGAVGLTMSFGALCVSVADTPGAPRHRINGMLATCFLLAFYQYRCIMRQLMLLYWALLLRLEVFCFLC